MLFQGDVLVDRYKLLELLERGGMGEVWIAEDILLDRKVAIKSVNIRLVGDKKALSVFKDEAKIGASLLGHPNIVAILDYCVHDRKNDDKDYFIVMEYVEGLNVELFINKFKSIIDEETYYYISLLIAWEIGRAIEYAHKQGILHRDIKPLNTFISRYGVTKVGDFGLARFNDAVTRTHTVNDFKSPPYSAPEQWRGEKHNKNTDIYQFGCTLYHLFTGRLIFEKNRFALMYAHLNEEPESPQKFCPKMPEELARIILKMVTKEGKDRTSLWALNDILAKELQRSFKLHVNVDKNDEEVIEKIYKITDFDKVEMRETGQFNFEFPDFNEVLSEGIQLIINNVVNFNISALERKVLEEA